MTPDLLLDDNPVMLEYRRQTRRGRRRVNLTPLWIAAGRRSAKSPRRWENRYFKRHGKRVIHDPGGGPDAPVWADSTYSLMSAEFLDVRIALAIGRFFMSQLKADPARQLAGCSDSVMAIFAVKAQADKEDIPLADAAERIIKDVERRTADMDPVSQETAVAKVRRAVQGIRDD
jgi:hypothetical protein